MSEDRMVTAREKVHAMRGAFLHGVEDAGMLHVEKYDWTARAIARYPLPKVTRPRVVDVLGEDYQLRVVDGVPQYRRGPTFLWNSLEMFGAPRLTVNGARVLVALLANPTEEVEADA